MRDEHLERRRLYHWLGTVLPIFADLDQELREAGASPWKRLLAQARCYCALARVSLTAAEVWPMFPRRVLAVGILSGMGMVAVTWALRVDGGNTPWPFVPFFLMSVAAPLLSRAFGAARTFQQMFWNCLVTGLLMLAVVMVYFFLGYGGRPRNVWAPLYAFTIFSSAVIAGSMVAAATFTRWAPDRESTFRRAGVALLAGTGVFVVVNAAMLSARYGHFDGQLGELLAAVFGVLLLALFFFLVPVTFVHLPVIFALGCFLRRPLPLAAAAGLTCPIPMLLTDLLAADEFGPHWFFGRYATGSILIFLRDAVPYFVATAFVGWLLGRRLESHRGSDASLA